MPPTTLANLFLCIFLFFFDFFLPFVSSFLTNSKNECTDIQRACRLQNYLCVLTKMHAHWVHTSIRNTWYNNVQRNTEIFQFTQRKGRTYTLISDSFHRTSPDFIGERFEWLLSHQRWNIYYIIHEPIITFSLNGIKAAVNSRITIDIYSLLLKVLLTY